LELFKAKVYLQSVLSLSVTSVTLPRNMTEMTVHFDSNHLTR